MLIKDIKLIIIIIKIKEKRMASVNIFAMLEGSDDEEV